jgi:hypothetical protein
MREGRRHTTQCSHMRQRAYACMQHCCAAMYYTTAGCQPVNACCHMPPDVTGGVLGLCPSHVSK